MCLLSYVQGFNIHVTFTFVKILSIFSQHFADIWAWSKRVSKANKLGHLANIYYWHLVNIFPIFDLYFVNIWPILSRHLSIVQRSVGSKQSWQTWPIALSSRWRNTATLSRTLCPTMNIQQLNTMMIFLVILLMWVYKGCLMVKSPFGWRLPPSIKTQWPISLHLHFFP